MKIIYSWSRFLIGGNFTGIWQQTGISSKRTCEITVLLQYTSQAYIFLAVFTRRRILGFWSSTLNRRVGRTPASCLQYLGYRSKPSEAIIPKIIVGIRAEGRDRPPPTGSGAVWLVCHQTSSRPCAMNKEETRTFDGIQSYRFRRDGRSHECIFFNQQTGEVVYRGRLETQCCTQPRARPNRVGCVLCIQQCIGRLGSFWLNVGSTILNLVAIARTWRRRISWQALQGLSR
ncbi:hypothetical protein M408DRAFT_157038 [Serendipita vermifera MAFF 305830]|uniref:Uncharacterized protein n=1 Tax=Serendipita vermifera MAFF 305830 TaxID=933852 RepID=A0A0C3B9S0_SERVB|nr:hypothetical protein M408DRAFT_157038 [Serendipita vermifera MAFF 305830]